MNIRQLAAITLILFAGLANAQSSKKENMTILLENESRFSFDESVNKLTELITAKGWKITVTHDLQETMKKNGKSVLPVKVVELCNPAYAYQILSADIYRSVSPLLPCRISVYEKTDGKTYVSRMNAPAFASLIGGEAEQTILKAYHDAEEIIRQISK